MIHNDPKPAKRFRRVSEEGKRKDRIRRKGLLIAASFTAVLVLALLFLGISGRKDASGQAIGGIVPVQAAEDENILFSGSVQKTVPMDSYYQYVNDYDWRDLYVLMIGIGKTGLGLNEGSEGKRTACSVVRIRKDLDPLIFIGFNDPVTNRSVMTLYSMDNGYVYELMKIREEEIFVDPETGSFMVGTGLFIYTYTPHVLLKTYTGTEAIPKNYVPLPITETTDLIVTHENVDEYVLDYSGSVSAP
ncbi:MAG: hypothetical protein IKY02_04595 [Lachnospiraceae bacterium]|nr:hypothetical protein [Lachnospiraceae bacterium]